MDDGVIWAMILTFGFLAFLTYRWVSKKNEENEQQQYMERRISQNNYAMQTAFRELERAGFKKSCEYKPNSAQWAFAVDKENKKWLISKNETFFGESFKPTVYNFSDLIDWSVSENGNTQISSNTGAAIGGAILFGTVGAVAASAGSREVQKTCSSLAIDLTVNSTEQTRCTLKIIEDEIPCDSDEFRAAMELVKNITAVLAYIKANAEQPKPEISEQPEQKAIEQPKTDIYEEIEKLHGLKEKGIITEEEFTQKKKSLLGI